MAFVKHKHFEWHQISKGRVLNFHKVIGTHWCLPLAIQKEPMHSLVSLSIIPAKDILMHEMENKILKVLSHI